MNDIFTIGAVLLQAPRGGFLSWLPAGAVGQWLLMLGVFLMLGLVFFMWAAFWRKPDGSGLAHHGGGLPKPRKRRSAVSRMFGRKHHKRSRSHHREQRINPTLAQSGGLPPRRDNQRPPN